MTKLSNYEDEDIFDVVLKLEKSFGLKFKKDAFYDVRTFGDLCDVITSNVQGVNSDDCTTQQAFYKIRSAIAATRLIDKNPICPDSKLQELFPRDDRRRNIKKLEDALGYPIGILDIKKCLGMIIVIGIAASLILFFFKWQFALTGLVLFIAIGLIANKFFAKEFAVETLSQLTEKFARENYVHVRRIKGTINRREILGTIVETFSEDLGIDKAHLTRSDKFS